MAWRYLLARANGDGTQTMLDTEIPLSDAKIVVPVSGAERVDGAIDWHVARLRDKNGPLFKPWNTILYAERDGVIRGAAFIVDVVDNGDGSLDLETIGLAGYPVGMPYDGDKYFIYEDVFNVVRHIWTHLQSQPRGDLGVKMPSGKANATVGEPERDVEFTTGSGEEVSFESGPYKLNFWSTDDLGRQIDDLADETPFEYRVVSAWNEKTEEIEHQLRLGTPRLGRRQHNLRFAVGENVFETPESTDSGDLYASQIWYMGAGEGRAMKMGREDVPGTGVRRVVTFSDKSIQSNTAAQNRARAEARRHQNTKEIDTIRVIDHPHAPLGSYDAGDEILLQTTSDWSPTNAVWLRIISMSINASDDSVDLEVVSADRM